MADDRNKSGGRDRTEINVNEDYELRYWSEKFNVSGDELREAVEAAGTNAEKVEQYLSENR